MWPWLSPLAIALALPLQVPQASVPPSSPSDAEVPVPRPLARRLGASGTVTIEVLLDTTGTVRATNVLQSQPLLDDTAAEAARSMRFEPARVDGAAVPSTRSVTFRFPALPVDPVEQAEVDRRCPETAFRLDLPPRPDSTGWIAATWQARGLKSQELLLLVLHPDGVEVDTTGSAPPLRVEDAPESSGWPTWRRPGTALRSKPDGTGGTLLLRVPDHPWWERGRLAFVALFHDGFEDRYVVRQFVFEITRDEVGALLLRDPRVPACSATTGHVFRKRG